MIYLLVGLDEFSREEELKRIKQDLGDEALLVTNTSLLEGAVLSAQELAVVAGAMPFLADYRLVLVSNLLKRFGTRGEQKPILKDGEAFYKSMTGLPSTTILVLIDDEVSEKNYLYNKLKDIAKLHIFPLLKGARLSSWIEERVKMRGGRIIPAAVELLARLVGSSLRVADSEITKLVLYAEKRTIVEQDVIELVGYAQQVSVFNLVDAIVEGRLKQAEQCLEKLLNDGASSGYLIYMVTRQLRLMLRTRVLLQQKIPSSEIAGRLGINNDFVWRKTRQQVAAYDIERLKSAYRHLLETDIAIKKGRLSQELALSLLIAELATTV